MIMLQGEGGRTPTEAGPGSWSVSLPAAPTPPNPGRALAQPGVQPGSPCPVVLFAHRPGTQATEKGAGGGGREDVVLPGLCLPGQKPAPFLTPLPREDHSERRPFCNCKQFL